MNSMKRAIHVALATGLLVLGLGLFKDAQAANPDTMTITVTPGGVNYAVAISSPYAQGYNFGTVNVGLTTISTLSIGVQNSGNIAEYFSLGVVDNTPTFGWANDLTPATTTYAMQALFQSAQPAEASFNGASNNVPSSPPGTAATKHGQASTKTSPSASQNLWLRLGMPTGVNDSGQHTLVLSVNGQGS